MIDAEKEQELRDQMLEAMRACDQKEMETVAVQMHLNGLPGDVIAANILLDLTDEQRDWWLSDQPRSPLTDRFVTIEDIVDRINEAARREGNDEVLRQVRDWLRDETK